jgi:hypothetical protein
MVKGLGWSKPHHAAMIAAEQEPYRALRDLLTIIAAFVILALTAALALPPLVDWNPHRAAIDGALARATGLPVSTEGAIEIRLLPSPRLKFERVRVGPRTGDGPILDAAFLRAEIALTPLLGGEVRIRDARIGRVELRLPLADGGDWHVPSRVAADLIERRRWIIEDLAINQMLLTRSDPATGRTDQAYAEAVSIEAQSLAGPWRVAGTSRGMPFQVATGELGTDNAMPVKVGAGGAGQMRLELDGAVRLRPDIGDTLVPDITGTGKITLGGSAPPGQQANGTAPAPPLRLLATATIKAASRAIALDNVALEAGEGGSSLRLAGTGQFRLDEPRLTLALNGRRLDLDPALAAGRERRWPALPPGIPAGGIPIDLALKLDSVGLGGEEWTGLEARASLARGRVALSQFTVAAPGPTQMNASGEFGFGFAQGGSGRIALSSRSGERFAAMLARLGWSDAAGLIDGRPFDLGADLVVAEPLVSLRNLHVALGDATLTGALRYTTPDGGARGRVDAQLALQGLDLARLPPSDRLFTATRGLDYGLILDMRNVGYGGGRGAGRIAARIASEGSSLRVERLEVADLAGANGSVSGRIEPDGTGRIEGRMMARRAAPLLDLAGPAWIGGLTALVPAGLRERDLDLSLVAERAAAPDGSGPGLRLRLNGRVAGGPFEAETVQAGGALKELRAAVSTESLRNWTAGPDTGAPARPARVAVSGAPHGLGDFAMNLDGDLGGVRIRTTRPVVVGLSDGRVNDGAGEITADDVSPLAGMLGDGRLAAVPAAAKLAATLGRGPDGLRVGLVGQVAGTDMTADLTGKSGAGIDGTIEVGRLSLPWLASAFALASPTGNALPGAMWPTARFGPMPAGSLQAAVSVKAADLDLGHGLMGRDATFDLSTSPDGVALRRLGFGLAEGRVEGEMSLLRQGGLAQLTGGGSARDIALPGLLGGDAFAGRVSADLKFGAAGESVAGLVANLGGAGSIRFDGFQAARADPAALTRVIPRALKSDDALAAAKLRGLVAEELDAAPLMLGTMSASATLIGGTLRAAPLRGEAEGASWAGSLSLDLRSLALDARGALQAKTAPPAWSGDPPYVLLGWTGSVSRPTRTLDVAPLVNGLASVVLTRELDRIDTFEADQNERQRRTSQREMDRLRKSAEEAARLAARRAREEAPPIVPPSPPTSTEAPRTPEPADDTPSPPPPPSRPPAALPPGG